MSRPHYTAGSESSYHLSQAGYCASDLVIQTAGIVINDQDKVMLLEDPLTNGITLPRSFVPHSLDALLSSPLGFLDETVYAVDLLPICMPARDYSPSRRDARPALTFTDHTATTPFAIALDLAYFAFSDLPLIPDGRQSIVLWYAGFVRDHPEHSERVHFLSFDDAVDVIERQRLCDTIGIRALRLFEKLWAATKRLPPEVRTTPEDLVSKRRAPVGQFRRHPKDITCYPEAAMENPVFPVATRNTTQIISNAFWAASDFYVQTGAILFNKQRRLVLLRQDTIPRCDGNDAGALLRSPLGTILPQCARLALPRLTKSYEFADGSDTVVAETMATFDKTTDPFFVTFNTRWAVKAKAQGRQALTFWFAGSFDGSTKIPEGCKAVPLTQALSRLQKADPYAFAALSLFTELWDTVKDAKDS
ncbi:hypothetical protein AURDEDRAFT_117579 [Auricularia subglabra TFB-10046 SS5]|uniref:Uncharacterized protein n=1 Tax=Auricularia subglabra (strain TFB-10046 / SS5) TaxID=717982 RepID=J0LDJ3_AURST|nr:hypothetical protein AURDEDRAFT_117579 [Auricularia subglabra TFB-10046 SS5]